MLLEPLSDPGMTELNTTPLTWTPPTDAHPDPTGNQTILSGDLVFVSIILLILFLAIVAQPSSPNDSDT